MGFELQLHRSQEVVQCPAGHVYYMVCHLSRLLKIISVDMKGMRLFIVIQIFNCLLLYVSYMSHLIYLV